MDRHRFAAIWAQACREVEESGEVSTVTSETQRSGSAIQGPMKESVSPWWSAKTTGRTSR